jgi:hypothetical protein
MSRPLAGKVYVTVHPSLLLRVCWPLRREEQYGLFLRDLRVTGISAGFIGGESSVCAGSAGPTL